MLLWKYRNVVVGWVAWHSYTTGVPIRYLPSSWMCQGCALIRSCIPVGGRTSVPAGHSISGAGGNRTSFGGLSRFQRGQWCATGRGAIHPVQTLLRGVNVIIQFSQGHNSRDEGNSSPFAI